MSFNDLDRDELYRSAIEDFAVEVEEDANAETIRAALLETGIKWADYVAQHPEAAPEPVVLDERVPEPSRGNVVTSKDIKGEGTAVVNEVPRVRVQESPVVAGNDKWLVKMTRDNTLFEIAGHKFTQQHPYALVSAEDAEEILKEDGFRQALPSELEDFYS